MTSRHSFSSALAWSYVMDGGRQVITSLITLVLAALLGPEIFGVIAMALVYILFIELLLKQGMGAAVIQRKDLHKVHLDSAFWLVMASSVILTMASIALSGWWAALNRTPELQTVIVALTPMIPLQGVIVVQEALLRRQFRFRPLALRTNLSALLGGALGIAMALTGWGVWALVAQQVSTVAVAVAVLWVVSDWRPRLRFSRTAARDLIGFSSGSFLGSLGVFLNNRVDALLIGLLFGPLVVGLYRLASRLVDMVIGITVRALQSVSLPELSRAQDDPARFKQRVLRLTGISALLGAPLLGVLAGSSEAVLGLVGDEWLPARNALGLLCVAGAIRTLFVFTGPMLQALGRPHLQAALAWLVAAVSGLGFLVAGFLVQGRSLDTQLLGLAMAPALLYGGVFALICVVLVHRFAGVRFKELLGATAPSIGAAVLAAAVGRGLWGPVAGSLSAWAALVAVALPAVLVALLVLAVADREFRKWLLQAAKTGVTLLQSLGKDGRSRRSVAHVPPQTCDDADAGLLPPRRSDGS